MKNLIKLLVVLAILATLAGCTNKSKNKLSDQLQLSGYIEGIDQAKVLVYDYVKPVPDTVLISKGKFNYTGNYKLPHKINLSVQGKQIRQFFSLFVQNGKMTFKSRLATDEERKSFKNVPIETTGCEFNNQYLAYQKEYDVFNKKLIENLNIKTMRDDVLKFIEDYIKKHPENPYPAYEIYTRACSRGHEGGASGKRLKQIADLISPQHKNHPMVVKMNKQIKFMIKTEAGLEKFVAGVPEVKYKVDKTFDGSAYKNMRYLSVFANNDLCMLQGSIDPLSAFKSSAKLEFNIVIIDNKGKEISNFEIKEKGVPAALVAYKNDLIYVLITQRVKQKSKKRGRTLEQVVNNGVVCVVYDRKGNKKQEFKLEKIKMASGAKIFDGKLLVADSGVRRIAVYNQKTGELISSLDDMRTCCGILDFDIDKKGNIIVANIGSFRVDVFDFKGKKSISFGQRGHGINEFHGCCNPVSVRKLNSGAVITVEKTPTRIKVYNGKGANTVSGINELVKGCSYIPVISDSNDNIFLASPEKGIVKCIIK